MFVRRDRTGSDRWLFARLAAFGAGAALALTGMALRSELLVNIAIGVLVLGFLLRFLGRRRPPEA